MAPKPSLVDKIVAKFGIPERVYVDNGRAFTSKVVQGEFAALGIEVCIASPYSGTPKPTERPFLDLTEVNLDELGER